MAKTDRLFALIRSMDKTEKRYFKRFASLHKSGNNYIRLFDYLNQQKQYDEGAIRRAFKGEPFSRHLYRTKNYLYKLILKSLRNYHGKVSADAEVKNLLRDVDILYTKGLYEDCKKSIQKARVRCVKYEKYTMLLEVFEWENKIILAEDNLPELTRYLKEDGEESAVLSKIDALLRYKKILNAFNWYLRKAELVRSPEQLKPFKQLNQDPLLKKPPTTRSFSLALAYHNLNRLLFMHVKQDFHGSLEHTKDIIELFEAHPHFIQEHLEKYVGFVYSLGYSYIKFKKFKKFREIPFLVKKLREITEQKYFKNNTINYMQTFIYIYALELTYYFILARYKQCKPLVAEIEAWLKRNWGKIEKKHAFSLTMYITTFYFIMGTYTKALEWLNRLLQDPQNGVREDIQSFARILNLIIHYELGHSELLEYQLRSTYRYLRQKEQLYAFEQTILEFIKKKLLEFNPNDKQAMKSAFRKLKERLQQLSGSPYEEEILNNSCLVPWLESKIRDRPLVDIMQENPPVRVE